MNNSSTQAWSFFNNSITSYENMYLYEVTECPDAEGVYGNQQTQIPVLAVNGVAPNGYSAILNDMIGAGETAACANYH
jgi:hypothetical protein